ncbi:MAG TPA: hypothetical protein DD379_17960 [Cyanobacteria bacterium UBA11162]|nr:hypothetical protein [Cyanobacteria bacterium UBA11162]
MDSQTAPHQMDDIKVVQASPGYVQLKVADSNHSSLKGLEQQLRQEVGVYTVKLDTVGDKLDIKFDANILPLTQMFKILEHLGVSQPTTPLTVEKTIPTILRESALLQLLICMGIAQGITRTFRLQGAWIIVANLMVGSGMRWLVDELETATPSTELASDLVQENLTTDTQFPEGSAISPPETLAVACQIIHTISGRIRLRVPRIAKDSNYTAHLEKLITQESQVTHVRINRKTASIAIEYQPGKMADSQMRSHLVNLILQEFPQESLSLTKREDEPSLHQQPITQETVSQFVANTLTETSIDSETPPQLIQTSAQPLNEFKPSFILTLFKSLTEGFPPIQVATKV